MKNFIFLSSIILALMFVSGCKKDKDSHDAEKPQITITNPAHDSNYGYADTIFIKANITHSENLHTYTVSARQEEDNSVTVIEDEHSHEKSIDIDTWFFPNVSHHKHYYIIVEAKDHDGIFNRDSVLVHINN